MEYLKRIGRGLWKICFVLNFITGLFILYPLFHYCLIQEARFPKAFRLMRFWARWILFVPGIRVAVTAAVDLKKVQGPVIFCANHVSYLDIVVSYFIIP